MQDKIFKALLQAKILLFSEAGSYKISFKEILPVAEPDAEIIGGLVQASFPHIFPGDGTI